MMPFDNLGLYILQGKTPVLVRELMEWAAWMGQNDRAVAQDVVNEVQVSTVFLGLDHNHFGGDPILFETMVFGGELDGAQQRYSTWDQAEVGHRDMVAKVRRTFIRRAG